MQRYRAAAEAWPGSRLHACLISPFDEDQKRCGSATLPQYARGAIAPRPAPESRPNQRFSSKPRSASISAREGSEFVTSQLFRRVTRTLAGAVLVAVGLAGGASQAVPHSERAFPGSEVFADQGGVGIVGGDADSAIETDVQSGGAIVIADSAGVSAANDPFPEDGFGCVSIDLTRARCDFPSDGGLEAFLGAGEDVLSADRAMPGQLFGTGGNGRDSVVLPIGSEAHLRFRGNKGSDVLTGASASDVLRGGPGADLLRGRAGHDLVNGKKGGDRLLGGPGGDSLKANDGDPDKRIECAGGADRAAVDRRGDPRPVSCEEVKRS